MSGAPFSTVQAPNMKLLGIEYGVALCKELNGTLSTVSVTERQQFLATMFTVLVGHTAKQLGPDMTVALLEKLRDLTPNAVQMFDAEQQHPSTTLN